MVYKVVVMLVASYGTLAKDELYLQNLTQNERMPEKDSSSDTPEDSGGSKLCADDTILGEKCGVEHDGVPASLSMFNESDKKSGHKDALVSKEKGNLVVMPFVVVNNVLSCFTIFTYWELVLDLYAGPKQNSFVLRKKLPKSSAGKRKNDNSAHCYTPPEQYADINQQFGDSSSGVTSLDSNQKHKQNTDYGSLGGILSQTPLVSLDFSHGPNHTSISSNFSGPSEEHDGYMSPVGI
ncbi:unnamed protein product [Trifolium pratense]|uniref:Uncharacterized protein n=1 Tax=Trifolium pratense TaxID=57577 RepID=A0ACB0JZL4_TRIPR|nr:unnamed protein product [Trifolium pratense]